MALVGLTLEDLNNDPSVRELVSEVFEKFRNDGCSDDTAAFDLRMTTFNKKKDDGQDFTRMSGRRQAAKRLTNAQIN